MAPGKGIATLYITIETVSYYKRILWSAGRVYRHKISVSASGIFRSNTSAPVVGVKVSRT